MAITNTLNTRIALKYDLLSVWMTSSLVLKKGEIAIAEIAGQNTINNDSAQSGLKTPPAIAMKVGDGTHTFAELPWVQAVAGDVYAWAKKANAPKLSELTDIDNELADLVGDIIDSTDKIQDTDTFYKVGSEKDGNKHKFVLHAYKKDGTTRDSAKDITIDWSDLDTWMAGRDERVQELITSALSTLVPLEVVNPDKKFVGSVEQVNGQIKVTKIDVEASDIQGNLAQSQVTGLETLQSEFNTAKGQLANTEGTISANNKLMTKSAVQEAITSATDALDELIVTQQGAGNYVTSVERTKGGAIVVTRDSLTHDKIGDWKAEVTDKLDLKANAADFFYSDDTATSATNYIVRRNDIDELTHGLHFRGEVDTDPTTWADPGNNNSYVAGDIVILKDSTAEYLFDGSKWLKVGDESLYATKGALEDLTKKHNDFEAQYAIDKGTLEQAITDAENNAVETAGENASAAIEAALELLDYSKPSDKAKFATAITQVNGKITDVSYSEVAISDIDGLQDHIDDASAKFNAAIGGNSAVVGVVAGNPLTTKAYVDEVAASAAEAEVSELKAALKVEKASDAGKFATSVTQSDGKIGVAYANIVAADITDTIPTNKLTDGTNIATILANIDGGVSALKTGNELTTKATVTAAVEAGVGALDSELHAIAKSGNVNNLVQSENEVLFLNCGSSSEVI